MTRPIEFPTQRPSSAVADWSLIAVPGVIWGASFLFIAEGLKSVGPFGVTLVRIAVGFAALAFFRAAWKPVDRADWPKIAALAVCWLAFPMALFPFAEQRISSAIAGMLNGMVPLFAAIIASVIAKALPPRGVLTGIAIGIGGVVLMAIPDLGSPSSAAGVIMVTVACMSYGFAPNIARPLQQKYGALPVIWRAQAVAGLLLLPLGAKDVIDAQWHVGPVLSLLALGALGTGVAHVVMTTASGRIGATKASASAFLIPPVALVLGVLVRDEHVALLAVIGGVISIAGAVVMRRANAAPAPKVEPMLKRAATVALLLVAANATIDAQGADSHANTEPRTRSGSRGAQADAAALPLQRLHGAIKVDGRSDDAAWQAITPLDLAVHLPTFGSPPTERTVVRVAYDDDALYLVMDAYEAHDHGIRVSSMLRDDDSPGDFLNLMLDTFLDRQNAVAFSTTPGGQRNDWTVSNDAQSWSSTSGAWNAVWDLATRRSADGWHAEYRIPFSSLRFTPKDGRVEFGMSINRLTAHSNERVSFPEIDPAAPLALWKPSRYQRVSVEGIHAARNVRFTPYFTGGIEGSRAPDPGLSPWARHETSEFGADFKMAVGQNLTLDLTANTDFAETEVDDQRVNLTRFPLLFPERRPFFVERSGTFEVKTGETDLLFNSRRVGLTADGRPVRLLGGARLVGQVRGWDVGFFDAQTDESALSSRENLGVLRLRRGVFNPRSWMGLMATSRFAADSSQVAFGADGDLYLGGDDYVSFGASVLAGDAGAGAGDGVLPRGALRLLAERRRNRDFWYRAGVSTTGSQYAPALGYVERSDAIRPVAEVGYGRQVSKAGHVVRGGVEFAGAYRNAAGTFEQGVSRAAFSLERPSGEIWQLDLSRQEDDLTAGFDPTPETSVPAGRFTANFAELGVMPATGPRFVVGGSVRTGEYFDGRLHSLTIAPEWRASAYLRVLAQVQVDRIEFDSRDEAQWSKLARVRITAAASPRLTLSALVQSNSLARLATANVRIRYNTGEGNDVWFVVGNIANLDRDRLSPSLPGTAATTLLLKVTRGFGR